MPVMKPGTSDRNLTPSSTGCASFSWTPVVDGTKIEHGQAWAAAVKLTLVAAPMFAASSTARAPTVTGPFDPLTVALHDVVPLARTRVAPLSVEISTAATIPPTSDAVPETVMLPPGTVEPA